MDNITHTLTGLSFAEAACQIRESKKLPTSTSLRGALYLSSAIANNLPDIDFIYTTLTGGKLGYLLHHRGHTHTLVAILPLTALVLGLLYWRKRKLSVAYSKNDWKWLFWISLLGGFAHIAMDGFNSYGIHPFWPFLNRWFYGDMIFIVEPLLWVSLLPMLFFAAKNKLSRFLLLVLFVGSFLIVWTVRIVPPIPAALCTLWGLGIWGASKYLSSQARLRLGLGAAGIVVLVFFLASQLTRSRILETKASPTQKDRDLVLSPFPSNPFCWTFHRILTSVDADEYLIKRGTYAPFPDILAASDCPDFRPSSETTAPLQPSEDDDSKEIRFGKSYVNRLTELEELKATNCVFAALLIFSRVPYWAEQNGKWIIGDLRYDQREGLDFAEFPTDKEPAECPRFLPGWENPLFR